MTKILLISPDFWNIHKSRMPLIHRLRQENYEVHVAAREDKYLWEVAQAGVKTYAVKHMKREVNNLFHQAKLKKELKRIMKLIDPAVVITFSDKPNIYGCLAAKNDYPVIATITGLGYPYIKGGWAEYAINFMYKRALRFADKVVFHNSDDRSSCIEKKLTSESKSLVIPGSGVDTNYFKPRDRTDKTKVFTFLFIGRLIQHKGINEFIEASKAFPAETNTRFQVVGDGDEEYPTDWNIPEDHGRVEFKGQVEDIRPLIAESDCVVLPSYREGMPRAILEAMSMAKPIITTDVPGCRDLVEEEENGLLVVPKSADSLTIAMARMSILTEEERFEMGATGRKMVQEKYAAELIVSSYLKLIDEVK